MAHTFLTDVLKLLFKYNGTPGTEPARAHALSSKVFHYYNFILVRFDYESIFFCRNYTSICNVYRPLPTPRTYTTAYALTCIDLCLYRHTHQINIL